MTVADVDQLTGDAFNRVSDCLNFIEMTNVPVAVSNSRGCVSTATDASAGV